ncbi:hypothetical protein TNCV_4881711 [Trichonephila clavipes]|nr:hypothetical protein TNCV_4881711 [Trichonephila clavipes]
MTLELIEIMESSSLPSALTTLSAALATYPDRISWTVFEWNATQSFRNLNELFGESRRKEWFVRFKFGDTGLKDNPDRGQSSNFHDQTLLAAVEVNEAWENSNANYQLQRGPFNHHSSPQSAWKVINISWMGLLRSDVYCKKEIRCVWWIRRGVIHWEIFAWGIGRLPSKWETVIEVHATGDGDYTSNKKFTKRKLDDAGAGAVGAYFQKDGRKRKTMIEVKNKYRILPREAGRDGVPQSTSVIMKQSAGGGGGKETQEGIRDGQRQ